MVSGTHVSAVRTTRYVVRYLYQILHGCGDPTCAKAYCKANIRTVFKRKSITKKAAINLAMHLASLRGDADLCLILKPTTLPAKIADCIDEEEPLKSPILSDVSVNAPKTDTTIDRIDPSQRPQHVLWANVKNVLPVSAFGKHFFDTHRDTLSTIGFENLKSLFEYFSPNFWSNKSKAVRDCCSVTDTFDTFDVNEKLYITRHIINSFNAYPSPGPDVEDETNHDPAQTAIVEIVELTPYSLWPYLNPRIPDFTSRPFQYKRKLAMMPEISHLEGLKTTEDYDILVGLNAIKAWPIGLNVASAKLQPYLEYLNPNIIENVCRQDVVLESLLFSKSRLPPSAPSYFASYLQLPFYEPGNKRYVFLTDERYQHLIPFQERVDLLRYTCLRHMGNCIQQSLAARNYSIHSQRLLAPPTRLQATFQLLTQVTNCFVVTISRDNMVQDAIKALSNGMFDWDVVHRALKVQFANSEQLAIDQGGVQVEFFKELGAKLIDQDRSGFKRDDESKLAWFDFSTHKTLVDFEYIGMLCGLAVYNGCTISVEFPLVMYKLIKYFALRCQRKSEVVEKIDPKFFDLKDMEEIMPTKARSFKYMLDNPDAVEAMEIPWHLSFRDSKGEKRRLWLKNSSSNRLVTGDYVKEYIEQYLYVWFFTSIQKSFMGFYLGFMHFVPITMVRSFSPEELRTIVEGTKEINVKELKMHTTYLGFAYDSTDPLKTSRTVRYFWNIVDKFDQEELADLLEFVTGTTRIPSGGLAKMRFVIQKNGVDDDRLPSSSVCFSRLLLPEYSSQEKLEKMLRLAIKHSVGFGLI